MLAHGASSLLSLKWCKAEQTVYVLCCCPHWPVGQCCHAEQFVLIFVVRVNHIGMNSLLFLSFFCLFLWVFLALPVTQTRARPPAHQSCVNARALPHHRARRVRTWWRRVQTTPLTSPPPRLSRLSRERTPCSRREAGERTQRWVHGRFAFLSSRCIIWNLIRWKYNTDWNTVHFHWHILKKTKKRIKQRIQLSASLSPFWAVCPFHPKHSELQKERPPYTSTTLCVTQSCFTVGHQVSISQTKIKVRRAG